MAHNHEHKHGSCCCEEAAEHKAHKHKEDACCCHGAEEEHGHSHGCSCGCGHGHGEGGGKGLLLRICVSAVLLGVSFLLPERQLPWLLLLAAAYLLSGATVLKEAAENILHGEVFDECFLMTVASLGAVCIGEWQEAAAVMVLYQLGEYLQDKAVDSSRSSITALMNIRPDTARVLSGGGEMEMAAEEVSVGAEIVVRPGERIPLDSVVLEGVSSLNTAALTGESAPEEVSVGDKALAGCVNLSGVLRLRVEKPFADSAASRILTLVEEASDKKAKTEQFITRFARVYTPVVVGIAVALAVLPPLLGLGAWRDFIYRALDFLVISCPCALVISVPLTYFAGLGCASRNGVLIKGGSYIDVLARVELAAFDKTGTLTEGRFSVTRQLPAEGISEETLLALAAHAESASAHPLALSVLQAYGKEPRREAVTEQQELAGRGVRCLYEGKPLLAGKAAFLAENGVPAPELASAASTLIFLAYDGEYLGALELSDTVKADAAKALAALRELGVRKTVLLSGDREETVEALRRSLGIDEAHARLLPEDKVRHMEKLLQERSGKGSLLYAGDGINDAPVLALADVGVAMGGLGTDAAMEASDVVIMGDEPSRIPLAIRIARKTVRVARENIVLALLIKAAVMLLAAAGYVGLWTAVFADVGVCLLAVLNSLRAART